MTAAHACLLLPKGGGHTMRIFFWYINDRVSHLVSMSADSKITVSDDLQDDRNDHLTCLTVVLLLYASLGRYLPSMSQILATTLISQQKATSFLACMSCLTVLAMWLTAADNHARKPLQQI